MKLKFLFSTIISLFLCGSGTAQDLPVDVSAVKGYLLGPGDEVVGKVLNEPQFDFNATVNEDGKIEVPFSDEQILAVCRTERELKADVMQLLSKYLRNPQLSFRVTERKSRPPATIYGEVRTPQQVVLMRPATLVELIAFSGGVSEEAGGEVQVFRTRPPLCSDKDTASDWIADAKDATGVPFKTYSLASVKMGKEDSNPVILPGDVIVVQKALPVYVTGEVIAPQGVYLKEGGMSLAEAIAKIGGFRREAKTKDVKIFRLKPNASPESKDRTVISANYDMIKKGTQKDIMLEPYDIIEVAQAKDSLATSILKLAIGAGRQGLASVSNTLGVKVLY